jgi:hypothetical protein
MRNKIRVYRVLRMEEYKGIENNSYLQFTVYSLFCVHFLRFFFFVSDIYKSSDMVPAFHILFQKI